MTHTDNDFGETSQLETLPQNKIIAKDSALLLQVVGDH